MIIHSHTKNQVNISNHSEITTKYLAKFQSPRAITDIDLIFGMWVYNDKLQIKLTLRSGPMIFGRVMALGL
jgi:hypothetical protein